MQSLEIKLFVLFFKNNSPMQRLFNRFSFYYKKIYYNNLKFSNIQNFIFINIASKLLYKLNNIKNILFKSNILRNNYNFLL